MTADFNIPPNILDTDRGLSEQDVAERQTSMVSTDEKYSARDVAVLIGSISRRGEEKQSEELIKNLAAVGCDASVVMHKMGNIANSISVANVRREGTLQNICFEP